MRVGRLAGTLAAATLGGGVLAGGAATGVVPVAYATVLGTLAGATLSYALGDRRFPVGVAAAIYLSAGAAALSGAISARPPWGAAVTGVGGVLLVGYLVRLRTGNARRLATLPIDPGPLRRFEASVADLVLSFQSVVERVAGLRFGRVRVGTVLVVGVWAAVVAGGTVFATTLPAATGAVASVGLIVALVWPFYAATDWRAIDAPELPPERSTSERLSALKASILVPGNRSRGDDAPAGPDAASSTEPVDGDSVTDAGDGDPATDVREPGSSGATDSGRDRRDGADRSSANDATAPGADPRANGSFTRGGTGSGADAGGSVPELDPGDRPERRRGRRKRRREADVPELRSVEEIGPTTAGSGRDDRSSGADDGDGGSDEDGEVPELDVVAEASGDDDHDSLGIADRVSQILEQNEGWRSDDRREDVDEGDSAAGDGSDDSEDQTADPALSEWEDVEGDG